MNKQYFLLSLFLLFCVSSVFATLNNDTLVYHGFESGSFFSDTGYCDAINNGTVTTVGKLGDARYYNGANYVTLCNITSSALIGNNGYSVNMWLNLNLSGARRVAHAYGSGLTRFWQIDTVNTTNSFVIDARDSNGNMTQVTLGGYATLNNWIMLTLVVNGTTLSAYVNGSLVTSNTNASFNMSYFSAMTKNLIGTADGTAAFFDGKIDEFSIHNNSLTDSDILTIYNMGFGQKYPFSSNTSYGDVIVYVRDEITGSLITTNTTITIDSNATLPKNTTSGMATFTALPVGTYSLSISNIYYPTRIRDITVVGGNTTSVTVYLLNNTYSTNYVVFSLFDSYTGRILDNVSIILSRYLAGSWLPVDIKSTDISGRTQFNFQPLTKYQFIITKDNYTSQLFYLNPILFTSYTIRLVPTTINAPGTEISDVSIIYGSTSFNTNKQNNFTFSITSDIGSLQFYDINISYTNVTKNLNGTNAYGETFIYNFNISNTSTSSDFVNLSYCYKSSLGYIHCYSYQYAIIGTSASGSWFSNSDNTFGLGLLERLLIITVCVIVMAGLFTLFISPIAGGVVGLFIFGFFVAVGFIPLWGILPSLLVGFFVLIKRNGQ